MIANYIGIYSVKKTFYKLLYDMELSTVTYKVNHKTKIRVQIDNLIILQQTLKYEYMSKAPF